MCFRIEGETVTFWLRVKAGSKRERLQRLPTGELCLEVSAPPREERANEACLFFLARSLRLPRKSVELLAGKKSRRKLVRISGRLAEETISRLGRLVTGSEEGQEAKAKSQELRIRNKDC